MKLQSILTAAVLTVGATSVLAQEEGGERPRPQILSPIMAVLDANKDGVLDATEIANASRALLTLDRNGDGHLTADELRPAGRGFGRPGGPGAVGGPGGRGPRDGQGPQLRR